MCTRLLMTTLFILANKLNELMLPSKELELEIIYTLEREGVQKRE